GGRRTEMREVAEEPENEMDTQPHPSDAGAAPPAAGPDAMASALASSGTAITMKQLLEAGVHFGHQTKRWNPKMKPYIFGARNGIYIIDLQQTVKLFRDAYNFVRDLTAQGGQMLFVGTKKQAQDAIREEAERCGAFYVNTRWLGGMLTNFHTIKQSIDRLKKLEEMLEDAKVVQALTKKEIGGMRHEREKLLSSLGGIKGLRKLPDALFVIDPKK